MTTRLYSMRGRSFGYFETMLSLKNFVLAVQIDGKKYSGWQDFSIDTSMENLCGTFSFKATNVDIDPNTIYAGAKVEVFVDDYLMLTGYIFKRSRGCTESSNDFTFSGREATADLVDCSATPKTYNNIGLLELCKKLCESFSIQIEAKTDMGKPFKKFVVESGETVFDAIEKACKAKGVLPLTNTRGFLELVSAGTENLSLVLDEKIIKSISEEQDFSDRFSNYTIKAQGGESGNTWTKANTTQLKAIATDSLVSRFRQLILTADQKQTAKMLEKNIAWEAQLRKGRSTSYSVQVFGFGKEDELLKKNKVIRLKYPKLGIDSPFLITSVKYSKSESTGTVCDLVLNDVETFKKLAVTE